jgi:hypothetical protein
MTSPFAPPQTETLRTDRVEATDDFYVVSTTKLAVLFVGTLGLYGVYWSYKHWDQVKQSKGLDILPWARGIFSIFFTHALFREVDRKAVDRDVSLAWSPDALATTYVVLLVAGRIMERADRFTDDVTLLTALATFVPLFAAIPMARGQAAANAVCGDPTGSSNASFTATNIVFLVVFGLFWILVLLGFAATLAGL